MTDHQSQPVFFQSPSQGSIPFGMVLEAIEEYVTTNPDAAYELAVGTDSQQRKRPDGRVDVEYAIAVTVRRIGNGGIFFYRRETEVHPGGWPLRDRIYTETMHSATLGQEIRSHLRDAVGDDLVDQMLQLHVDVGTNGPTRTMIGEVLGIARGFGFDVKIKPEAYCAAAVADRHT